MGKIQNWKNIGNGVWENEDYERREIRIKEGMEGATYGDAMPGEYVIVLDTPIEHRMLKHDNQQPMIFQNWENAREEAVDWMEDHPYAEKEIEDGTYEFTDATSFYELIIEVEDGRAVSGTAVDSTGTYDFQIRRNGRIDFDRGMAEDPPSSNDITRKLHREGIPYGE
jgi:hypothetical protein